MRIQISDEVLEIMAGKFRLLSDATRLKILRALMIKGERNVGQVVVATGGTLANVSKHLKQLAEAGLLARRKVGLNVLYRMDDPIVEKICELVCETIVDDLKSQASSRRKRLAPQGKNPPRKKPPG